ncbi:MAG TPA: hypothetical protein VI011_01120 [Asanoa sp.]
MGAPGRPPGPPPWQQAAPVPRRKHRGLVITSIVLAVVLVLCGGGGLAAFLVLRRADTGRGADEPVTAVERFLEAVYTDQNAAAANAMVCRSARDAGAIERKVAEVRDYAKAYPSPRFRWDKPKIDDQNAERAIVSTKVRMTTADDRSAEQRLTFTVVRTAGWWVCDVS